MKSSLVTAWLVAGAVASVQAQVFPESRISADSVLLEAAEVVTVMGHSERLSDVAGAVALLDANALQSGAAPDLQECLNEIPGVKFESRGYGGSRRISVRGSSIRSPYAVRNTLLIADGFYLSSADGVSPFEWISPSSIARAELLKGPAGSTLGSGYGGALVLHLMPDDRVDRSVSFADSFQATMTLQGSLIPGPDSTLSLGFDRSIQIKKATEKFQAALNVDLAKRPGYREQEANGHNGLGLHLRWGDQARYHVWVQHYDGSWELPGSLNADVVAENPQAGPGLAYDAHVDRVRNWLGISRVVKNDNGSWGVWALGQLTSKTNPFGTSPFYHGYKKEEEQNLNLRFSVEQNLPDLGTPWLGAFRVVAFAQAVALFDDLLVREWDIAPSLDGALKRYDVDLQTRRNWGTGGFKFQGVRGGSVTLQCGAEAFRRAARSTTTEWEIALLPRIGLLLPLSSAPNAGRLFAQYATGTSQPTHFEWLDPETYNETNLRAERAGGFEIGYRKTSQSQAHTELVFYHQRVKDAILPITGENDAPSLSNKDHMLMSGLEVSHSRRYVWENSALTLRLYGNLPRHQLVLSDVADSGEIEMPGTPKVVAGATVRLRRGAWSMRLSHRYTGVQPLNDANTDYSEAYTKIDADIAFSTEIRRWEIELKAGVRNVLNERYSDWHQVNAFGGKYFNPAPSMNAWLGVQIRF